MTPPCFAKDYYIIIDTDGSVLRIVPTAEANPNANERKLFKIIVVDIPDDQYDQVSSDLMIHDIEWADKKQTIIKEMKNQRKNKINTLGMVGKSEKVILNDVIKKIKSRPAGTAVDK